MPTISSAGNLMNPIYIVLPESGGKFGPRVLESLFTADNLYISASSSGKMGKQHLLEQFKMVYFPDVSKDSILLVDSGTTYNDKVSITAMKLPNSSVKILQIPPKTIGITQPADVYFYRMWKNFVRNLSD